jgi:hypothetical protein
MKRTFIYATAVLVVMSFLFTSCKPSRVWTTKKKDKQERSEPVVYNRPPASQPAPPPAPRYYNAIPLIVSPTPGFIMKQDRDGRYFHRNPQGYLYWKGNDNRFYIDSYHLSQLRYSQWEYDEWKRLRRASR